MKENKNILERYIKNRIKQGTVILCFKILLDNAIKNGYDSKLTKSQINKEFDAQHKNFGIGTFRSDYLLRQSAKNDLNVISVMPDNSTFFIRRELLDCHSTDDLLGFSRRIQNHYNKILLERDELINLIDDVSGKSISERKEFIVEFLLRKETGKKGQAFEVVAFAILKSFYHIRGFDINRFSTVYSNDGGVDYSSQFAIYQVTTSLSNRKFAEDLSKAPLKSRILVYKQKAADFNVGNFDDELVLDYIGSEDLMSHLDYLISKKAESNIKMIFETIKHEFNREYHL